MKSSTIDVDIAGICSISSNCNGCPGSSRQCCSNYEVTVTGKEMRNMVGSIPLATRYCPHLKSAEGYENVFDRISGNLFSIDTREDGTCLFAYFKNGGIFCSLHTVALLHDISFIKIKPSSCLLWPLALSEEDVATLSIQDDAFEFTCNTRRKKNNFSVCPTIATNIELVFGKEFLENVKDAAKKRLTRAKISVG